MGKPARCTTRSVTGLLARTSPLFLRDGDAGFVAAAPSAVRWGRVSCSPPDGCMQRRARCADPRHDRAGCAAQSIPARFGGGVATDAARGPIRAGFGGMTRSFLRALRFFLALALLPARWVFFLGRAPRRAFVSLAIDGVVVDFATPRPLWQRLAFAARARPVVLSDVSELVDTMCADRRIAGLLLTIRSPVMGMAGAASLRAILRRLRDAKKEVVVHLPYGADTTTLYVATVGTKILVGPQATLAPLGFASSVHSVKRALDRLGLVPQVLARGSYKTGAESLVREAMSDAHREQIEAVQEESYVAFVDALCEGRRIERSAARRLLDGAPYRAGNATDLGLVDGVAYEDELPEKVGVGRAGFVLAERYLRCARGVRLPPLLADSVVAIIPVHGSIGVGGGDGLGLGIDVHDDVVIAMVRAARTERRVKSVLLHVDSPGGDALASDRIHHEVELLAREKPVVACFANVAASGGYYVAAAAHEIVAQPTTVTGSIGVLSARVAWGPLMARLGIVTQTVKRGERADMFDWARANTEPEREALERDLDGAYRAFVRCVARGRRRSVEEIESVAQGRVWTGAAAQRRGLVDTLGGFEEALASARRRAGDVSGRLAAEVLRPARGAIPAPAGAAQVAQLAVAALGLPAILLARGPHRRVLAWCACSDAIGVPQRQS